jgi:hypothetical protein
MQGYRLAMWMVLLGREPVSSFTRLESALRGNLSRLALRPS